MAQTASREPNFASASNLAVAVAGTGNTELLEINTRGLQQLAVQFVVTTQNLDAFIVEGRPEGSPTYSTITSAVTATPGGVVIAASGTLASAAAGTTLHFCILNVRGLSFVRIKGSAAADSAAVDIYASAA